MKGKILLVEDDSSLSNGIVLALQENKYEFLQAFSIKEACTIWELEVIGCIILDINLPDGSGYDFLRMVRKESNIPVLVLTANDMELDEVMGFRLGADDYMTKPFSLMVLRARIENLLKRGDAKKQFYIMDDFSFDFEGMLFRKGKQELNFSKTEQRLLKLLIENKGSTLTRDFLMDRLWTDAAEYVDENALSVAILRLRNKLEENPSKPEYIKTVYGLGYAWGKKN